jgi:hypothetical protein
MTVTVFSVPAFAVMAPRGFTSTVRTVRQG